MILCPPRVVGPVSECSSAIIVEGQVSGSTVNIILNGDLTNPLCHDVASSSRQIFTFPAGSLKAGDCLTAIQSNGTDTSAESPELVTVQKFDTTSLDKTVFDSHLYVCGRHLFIDGAIPGATVEILSTTGTPHNIIGKGSSIVGYSYIDIDPVLHTNESVAARQTACSKTGPEMLSPLPDPTPLTPTHKLPIPFIREPSYGCDKYVLVEGIVPGADVTLYRNRSIESTVGTPFDSVWITTKSPLNEGDELTVFQEMKKCELKSGISHPPHVVKAAKDIPAPIIADTGPLCVGTTGIQITNLRPGALVKILNKGNEIEIGESPDSSFTFYVPPLPKGAIITAQQSLCNNIWSPESNSVEIEAAPTIFIPAEIAINPLYECTTSVPITKAIPGSWIRVISKRLGQISSPTYITSPDSRISVSPALQATDVIYLEQFSCGKHSIYSKSVGVVKLPPLSIPQIVTPVYAGQHQVTVKNIIPTAIVEIYLNGKFQVSGISLSNTFTVNLGVQLKTGDKLNARQKICNKMTKIDPEYGVNVITLDINNWLQNNQSISDYIVWEDDQGTHAWSSWGTPLKNELQQAFELASNQSSISVADVPPNQMILADDQDVVTILAPEDAWAYFKASVAQSLAFELDDQIPWHLSQYNNEQLPQILDSREMFSWTPSKPSGYRIDYMDGAVVPAPPSYSYKFLINNALIGTSRLETLGLVIDWCRSNLIHYSGDWKALNMDDQWQYRGFPPMYSVLEGTIQTSRQQDGIMNRTAGCWGTVGLLRSLLRAVNIPVKLIENCGHAQPWFMADAKYLSHGDDPYNQLSKSTPPFSASEILIDQNTFDAWFGASANDKCSNISRQTKELALIHLPNYLLHAYCRDMATGKSHADGEAFEIFSLNYTVTQLESKNLWTRMDAKIAGFGGCSKVP